MAGLLEPRRDFLRNDEEDVTRGRSEARVKSSEREGSLGWDIVEEVVSVGVPRNWDAKSLYCVCSLCSVSCMVREALIDPSAPSPQNISTSGCLRGLSCFFQPDPFLCNVLQSFPQRI